MRYVRPAPHKSSARLMIGAALAIKQKHQSRGQNRPKSPSAANSMCERNKQIRECSALLFYTQRGTPVAGTCNVHYTRGCNGSERLGAYMQTGVAIISVFSMCLNCAITFYDETIPHNFNSLKLNRLGALREINYT